MYLQGVVDVRHGNNRWRGRCTSGHAMAMPFLCTQVEERPWWWAGLFTIAVGLESTVDFIKSPFFSNVIFCTILLHLVYIANDFCYN